MSVTNSGILSGLQYLSLFISISMCAAVRIEMDEMLVLFGTLESGCLTAIA
jgi:hypothetical protein